MRSITLLLSVVLIASAALAVEPKPNDDASIQEQLKYINEHMLNAQDIEHSKCSDKQQLSISDDRAEILVKNLFVDRDGKFLENVSPKFVYHVPVAAVENIYIWGRWTTKDRVVVKTNGTVVKKYGPVWDCVREKLDDPPNRRFLATVELRIQSPDDRDLSGVVKALKRVVELLQAEQEAKSAAGKKVPDEKDSLPDHK